MAELVQRYLDHGSVVQRTLSVMVTCGMYAAAGDWVSAVGRYAGQEPAGSADRIRAGPPR